MAWFLPTSGRMPLMPRPPSTPYQNEVGTEWEWVCRPAAAPSPPTLPMTYSQPEPVWQPPVPFFQEPFPDRRPPTFHGRDHTYNRERGPVRNGGQNFGQHTSGRLFGRPGNFSGKRQSDDLRSGPQNGGRGGVRVSYNRQQPAQPPEPTNSQPVGSPLFQANMPFC